MHRIKKKKTKYNVKKKKKIQQEATVNLIVIVLNLFLKQKIINENKVFFSFFFLFLTNCNYFWVIHFFFGLRFKILQALVCSQQTIPPHYEHHGTSPSWPLLLSLLFKIYKAVFKLLHHLKCANHSKWTTPLHCEVEIFRFQTDSLK